MKLSKVLKVCSQLVNSLDNTSKKNNLCIVNYEFEPFEMNLKQSLIRYKEQKANSYYKNGNLKNYGNPEIFDLRGDTVPEIKDKNAVSVLKFLDLLKQLKTKSKTADPEIYVFGKPVSDIWVDEMAEEPYKTILLSPVDHKSKKYHPGPEL